MRRSMQRTVVAQRAAEVVAGEGVEAVRVDAMGQAALPQRVQLAAVHDHGGVGGVLEAHAQQVLVEAAGDVGAEVAIEDLAGGLLLEELPRAHVAVAIDHAPLGEGEAVQVAVAVEGVAVALPVDLEPAGPVAKQDAAQAAGRAPSIDLERDPRPRR
jgi:hypothetical protein